MNATDLLATALRLAKASPSRPKQSDLRRAISTAYYALFHALAEDCANLIVGSGKNASDAAWAQAYRALEHGFAKNACSLIRTLGFPDEICLCGAIFIRLQELRHAADYDPAYLVFRADVINAVDLAALAIAKLKSCNRKDRRAFAVQLLLRRR